MGPALIAILCVLAAMALLGYARFSSSGSGKVALKADKWQSFRLSEKIQVSPDSYIFRFALHNPDQTLGLPTGSHIAIRAICNVKRTSAAGVTSAPEMVQHTYTPISSDEDKGRVDFMIKVYFENANPKFPFGGRLSQRLHEMRVGEAVEMMGPKGHFAYLGGGRFTIAGPHRSKNTSGSGGGGQLVVHRTRSFTMVAGGTGITPLLQVMRAIHRDPADKTRVFIVYCNRTEKDILLRAELDALAAERSEQFTVWHTITQPAGGKPPRGWRFATGHIDEDMLRAHVPMPVEMKATAGGEGEGAKACQALLCGPTGLVSQVLKPGLAKLGYDADSIFTF